MLTPEQDNIRQNLEHFLKAGTLDIKLSRRDVVHLLALLRHQSAPDIDAGIPTDAMCYHCKKAFTRADPARVSVRGHGLIHGACADALKISWRACL